MSKLSLMQIESFLEENFPFDLLQIEPTEEFLEELTSEVRVILNESGCKTFEKELYFLSQLVDRKYWEKRLRRQRMEQVISKITAMTFPWTMD